MRIPGTEPSSVILTSIKSRKIALATEWDSSDIRTPGFLFKLYFIMKTGFTSIWYLL